MLLIVACCVCCLFFLLVPDGVRSLLFVARRCLLFVGWQKLSMCSLVVVRCSLWCVLFVVCCLLRVVARLRCCAVASLCVVRW